MKSASHRGNPPTGTPSPGQPSKPPTGGRGQSRRGKGGERGAGDTAGWREGGNEGGFRMDFARFNGTRHADVNLPALVGFNAPLKQPHLYPPLRNVHHLPLYFTLSTHLRPTPPSPPHRPPSFPLLSPALSPTSIPNPLTTLPVDPIYVRSRARSYIRSLYVPHVPRLHTSGT